MLQLTLLLTIAVAVAGCVPAGPGGRAGDSSEGAPPAGSSPTDAGHGPGRLRARPQREPTAPLPPGLQPLGLGEERDGVVYIPPNVDQPAPLVVMLHGAGGEAERAIRAFLDDADDEGLVLLAVDSRSRTWDVILGDFGPDVSFINEALRRVFAGVAVDPDRIAVEGFSDGASYALSLGLTNGDLFDAVIAFSPGFSAASEPVGTPRVFIAHGTDDGVLPIDRTSRRIVPQLRSQGLDVRYEEFEGRHDLPRRIARAGLSWLTQGWGGRAG